MSIVNAIRRFKASRENISKKNGRRAWVHPQLEVLESRILPAGGKVLILGSTVTGGANSREAQEAIAQGLSVDVVDNAGWMAKTQADFASYQALILGDPNCSGDASLFNVVVATQSTWGPIVNGNIVIIGTDLVYHAIRGIAGAEKLIQTGIDFTVAQPGKTGMYVDLSCYYAGSPSGTPVPVLDAFDPGGFTVTKVNCTDSGHIVPTGSTFSTLTDADVKGWECSLHEAFVTFPADFAVVAMDPSAGSSYTAPDGTVGDPYILARGSDLSSTATRTILSQPVTNVPSPGGTDTIFNQAATFTATVRSFNGNTPIGSVAFLDGGTTLLAGVAFSSSTGTSATATYTTSALSVGAHTISAVYTSGDSTHFDNSTSANLTHTVDLPADTTTAITASDNAPVFGETVTYTASISAVSPGTGVPANGTVTFSFDGGAGLNANVSSGRAKITKQWPSAGTGHTVGATYNGDDTAGFFHASTAPEVMVTVNPDTTTTTLSQPVTNLPKPGGTDTYLNQPATFTVTVRSAHGGTPTGSVAFLNGPVTLQAGVAFSSSGTGSATATFTTSGLSAGRHTISVVYTDNSGDNNFSASTSARLIHIVDFHLTPLVPGVTPTGSYRSQLTAVNGITFFTAYDGTHGQELWETNGSAAGTFLVKDINPGSGGSNPANLTNVNGTLFFSATDGAHGTELWKSDGSFAGTVQVKDINAGSGGSYPANLTNVNGTLFFSATNGISGVELWRSNGTAPGTVLIKDINPGSASSYPSQLTNVNDTLFFVANDGIHGRELFESNGIGTGQGTVLVKDINAGSASSYPSQLTNVNGTLFFSATSGVSGQELWRSNGATAGTVIVKDIRSGSVGSYPSQLTNVNGTLFFVANDGIHGPELFESNGIGTGRGTLLVKDINSGSAGSYPSDLTNVNGTLFFSATSGVSGQELWRSNGTTPGTVLVEDINPGVAGSNPSQLTNVNGTLFFVANDGVHGAELFESNGVGTGGGSVLVADINPGSAGSLPTNLTNVNGTLFFSANDGHHGRELWELSL
jgi:ELWxxDGT repeat protein